MRIVQINAVSGVGSTGNIVEAIHNELTLQSDESFVFWATRTISHDARHFRVGSTFDHKIHAFSRRVFNDQGFHSKLATRLACKKIRDLHPDVVHLHNLHSNYIHLPTLLNFLAKERIAVLVTIHDCWFFTGGCTHFKGIGCEQWKKSCANCPVKGLNLRANILFDRKLELFHSLPFLAVNGVSEWTTRAARESAILSHANLYETIYNWVGKSFNEPVNNIDMENVKRKYNIPLIGKIILGVSQGWSDSKGLKEFFAIADNLEREDFHVVLVGNHTSAPAHDNITYVNYTENQRELICLYTLADVFVNPSKYETFGLTTAEAMACGTPIVAYNNTGAKEIVTSECGILAEDGNVIELIESVKTILSNGKKIYFDSCIKRVKQFFNKDKQVNKYISLYKEIISRK